jgi:IS4 transposase
LGDYAAGNAYRFLNNESKCFLTMAELYRKGWQVEYFFKWIKQLLHVKPFYETIQKAVFSLF